MQRSQDQITTLIKKIQQQDDIIAKLKIEQTKLTNYVRQFRQAIQKKMSKEQGTTPKTAVDEQKLQKQMQKQLDNAKLMLRNYQNQLKALQKKSGKNTFTADDLIEMEASIKKKQAYIHELNEDIKNLNAVKRKQQKLIDKKQKNEEEQGAKLTRLVQQVRKQKQILQNLKIKHKSKQDILEKRKAAINQMEKQYIQKCKEHGIKPLSFQQFKEKRLSKKRDESVNRLQSEQKKDTKKPMTVKDIINSHLLIQNVQISEKGLNQLKEKKIVAQNSLKIAKKKYEKQIEELQEKIESLKKENQTFNTKYLQKKKQKELIQSSKTMDFKKNSSRTTKKLQPIK